MSGMTGTGLKKCMPTKRARRSGDTASASRSIAIELVFEAKIVAGGASAVQLAPQRGLDGDVLEDRLDDEIRLGNSSPSRPWRRCARGSRRARRPSACPWRRPARGCRRSDRDPPSARARSGSYSVDLLADRRVDLGDAVAHQAGAGDEDPLDRHASSVAAAGGRPARASDVAPRRQQQPPRSRRPRPTRGTRRRSRRRRRPPRGRPATARTRGRRTGCVVPTTAPRSVSSTRDTARVRSAGIMNAMPEREHGAAGQQAERGLDQAEERQPDGRDRPAPMPDSACRARPGPGASRRPAAARRRAAAYTASGAAAPDMPMLLGIERDEGEEAGHPPRPEQHQEAREEAGRVEQRTRTRCGRRRPPQRARPAPSRERAASGPPPRP